MSDLNVCTNGICKHWNSDKETQTNKQTLACDTDLNTDINTAVQAFYRFKQAKI